MRVGCEAPGGFPSGVYLSTKRRHPQYGDRDRRRDEIVHFVEVAVHGFARALSQPFDAIQSMTAPCQRSRGMRKKPC